MPSSAPNRLDSNQWRAHVDALRRGPSGDVKAYRLSQERLALGMTDAAGCLHSFIRSLGQAAFDDAVSDAIFGTAKRKGLLDELENAAEPVEYPKAWLLKSLNRRLIDVQRKLGRERSFIAEQRDLGESGMAGDAGLAGDSDPGAVPREVEKTLTDVANFTAVLLGVCDELPAKHEFAQPPAATRKVWRDSVKKWSDSAGHLRRDLELGADRLRWPDGFNGNDNHARAWQVRYYHSVGATNYYRIEEMPQDKRSAEGALSYQHLGRFRKTYSECAGLGGEIVDGLADIPLQPLAPGQKRRPLPIAWEPARHHTLAAEDK